MKDDARKTLNVGSLKELGLLFWNILRKEPREAFDFFSENKEKIIVLINDSEISEVADFIANIGIDSPELARKILGECQIIKERLQNAPLTEFADFIWKLSKTKRRILNLVPPDYVDVFKDILKKAEIREITEFFKQIKDVSLKLAENVLNYSSPILREKSLKDESIPILTSYFLVIGKISDSIAREIIKARIEELKKVRLEYSRIDEIGAFLWTLSMTDLKLAAEIANALRKNILAKRLSDASLESITYYLASILYISAPVVKELIEAKKDELMAIDLSKKGLKEIGIFLWCIGKVSENIVKELINTKTSHIKKIIAKSHISELRSFLWILSTVNEKLSLWIYNIYKKEIHGRLKDADYDEVLKFIGVINTENPTLAKEISKNEISRLENAIKKASSYNDVLALFEIISFADQKLAMSILEEKRKDLKLKFGEEIIREIKKRIRAPFESETFSTLSFSDEISLLSNFMKRQ